MGVARASLWLLALVALSAALLTLQPRSVAFAAHCSGTSYHPDPTTVTVDAVPIVAESTTDEYFALYVKHDVDGTEVELPVLVKRGEAGTTTLAENVEALPAERYRVEKYLIADPADVDGDCIDDMTELADPVGMNPVNPAPAVALNDGAVVISDRDTFEALAVSSRLKFIAFDVATGRPVLYFLNTKTHDNHISFLDAVGLDFDLDAYRGDISYDPTQVASDGSLATGATNVSVASPAPSGGPPPLADLPSGVSTDLRPIRPRSGGRYCIDRVRSLAQELLPQRPRGRPLSTAPPRSRRRSSRSGARRRGARL